MGLEVYFSSKGVKGLGLRDVSPHIGGRRIIFVAYALCKTTTRLTGLLGTMMTTSLGDARSCAMR
jgi:hypothetical protein